MPAVRASDALYQPDALAEPPREAAVAHVWCCGRPLHDGAVADDDRRNLRPCHGRVEHLASQEVRPGGRMGDEDGDGKLDPLALVDRAGVGEAQAVELVVGY